jgi:hypothetical protein
MAFDWTTLIPGYKKPQMGATPPYVGGTGAPTGGGAPSGAGGGTSTPQQQTTMQQILPWLVGGGLSALGTGLASRAQGQQNQQLQQRTQMMDQLARDEMARKEAYASMILPSLMQAIGIKNPNLAAMALRRQQALPGYGGQLPQAQQPSTGTMTSVGGNANNGTTFDAAYAAASGQPYYQTGTRDGEY